MALRPISNRKSSIKDTLDEPQKQHAHEYLFQK